MCIARMRAARADVWQYRLLELVEGRRPAGWRWNVKEPAEQQAPSPDDPALDAENGPVCLQQKATGTRNHKTLRRMAGKRCSRATRRLQAKRRVARREVAPLT